MAQSPVEGQTMALAEYLSVLWRRRWWVAATAGLIAAGAAVVATVLPPVYESTATILIEQQAIPQDLVRSTVTSFADERIKVINQRVMTRANILDLIRKHDLFPGDRDSQPAEVLVQRTRGSIGLDVLSGDVIDPRSGRLQSVTIAFTVSYRDRSPAVAQKVASELVSLYLNENLRARSQATAATSGFLEDEGTRLGRKVAELEARMAEFKERHSGRLPDQAEVNLRLLEQIQRELAEVDRQLDLRQQRRVFLQADLEQLAARGAETGAGDAADPRKRLQELQAVYLTLSARYTSDHPDLARVRRELAAMQASVRAQAGGEKTDATATALRTELAAARTRYGPSHPDVLRLERELAELQSRRSAAAQDPDRAAQGSPTEAQINSQIKALELEVQSLGEKRKALEGERSAVTARVAESPQVERELRNLVRDYENTVSQYREVRAKLLEAQLAEALEAEQKGERFTLIDPPQLPGTPVRPNRPAILLIGLILAAAGGVAVALGAETLRRAVFGAHALARVVGMPPLAVIPHISTAADARRRLRRRRLVLTLTAVSLPLVAVAVHWLVRPLDLLWLIAVQRFGL